jgi:hypothetical protein
MLDLAGETCLIHHKNVPFYRVDEAKVHILEGFSLEEGLSSASTVTILQHGQNQEPCYRCLRIIIIILFIFLYSPVFINKIIQMHKKDKDSRQRNATKQNMQLG